MDLLSNAIVTVVVVFCFDQFDITKRINRLFDRVWFNE